MQGCVARPQCQVRSERTLFATVNHSPALLAIARSNPWASILRNSRRQIGIRGMTCGTTGNSEATHTIDGITSGRVSLNWELTRAWFVTVSHVLRQTPKRFNLHQ